MATLIAGGDSFVYGSELKDCWSYDGKNNTTNEQASLNTYPALIAKELGWNYICAAKPAASNNAIRRLTMNACENNAGDIALVIVTWSFPSRYEFKFAHDWEQLSVWSIQDDIEEKIKKDFHNANPIVFQAHIDKLKREQELGVTEFAKLFYKQVGHTEYWEVYNSLSEMVLLQQYLELKNIPYLFTGVDSCLVTNSLNHNDQSIITLRNQLNLKNWMWFSNNRGFYTWSKDMNFPFGTTHPLEEAHVEAAHIIYEHLRYIGRLP